MGSHDGQFRDTMTQEVLQGMSEKQKTFKAS